MQTIGMGCLSKKGYTNLGDKFAEKTKKANKEAIQEQMGCFENDHIGWMELQKLRMQMMIGGRLI